MPRDGDGLHLVGAIWHFRYRSPDGRWKEKSTGKHKITEAKAERTRFLRAFADGLLPTVLALAIRRYQAGRRETVGPKTVNNELLVLIGVLKQAKLWKRLEEDYKPLAIPKQGPGKALVPDEGEHLIATARTRPAWDVALSVTRSEEHTSELQ